MTMCNRANPGIRRLPSQVANRSSVELKQQIPAAVFLFQQTGCGILWCDIMSHSNYVETTLHFASPSQQAKSLLPGTTASQFAGLAFSIHAKLSDTQHNLYSG